MEGRIWQFALEDKDDQSNLGLLNEMDKQTGTLNSISTWPEDEFSRVAMVDMTRWVISGHSCKQLYHLQLPVMSDKRYDHLSMAYR